MARDITSRTNAPLALPHASTKHCQHASAWSAVCPERKGKTKLSLELVMLYATTTFPDTSQLSCQRGNPLPLPRHSFARETRLVCAVGLNGLREHVILQVSIYKPRAL